MTITRESRDLVMHAGAIFSDCERYRYLLWREWAPALPTMTFCMLNPSTATHEVVDPTIQRCLNRASRSGFGRLEVVNLFAYRATEPWRLRHEADPIGPENDEHIAASCARAALVICGWGNDRSVGTRGAETIAMLRAAGIVPHALFLNQNGSPKHPLYVAAVEQPFRIP